MELYARIFQFTLKYGSYILPWTTPEIIDGENPYQDLLKILLKNKHQHILIVTDKSLMGMNLLSSLFAMLDSSPIKYHVYDETRSNPTRNNTQAATSMYRKHNCDGIIAFGGGSSIDCAKAVGACIARPNKPIHKMKGLSRVLKKIPLLYAIPTTAGSGSETTIAAVITNEITHEKYAISDIVLVPKYAILDANLTLNLPQHLTSTTGMDALTHAVEAYIGRSNTKQSRADALYATKLVYDNLFNAYTDGHNFNARKQMQLASFYGGKAFTRAYVGNVHAMAHALGGLYSIPHGLANAVILPQVLRYYGNAVEKPLAELADHVGMSESSDTQTMKCEKFISWVEKMNSDMNIPTTLSQIKMEDIDFMVNRAYSEANPLYPVPVIFRKDDFKKLYMNLMA